VRVYRVAKDGLGPYQCLKNHNVDLSTHQRNNPRTPSPRDDFSCNGSKIVKDLGINFLAEAYYGFRSLEAMFRWFTPSELAGFSKAGFIVSVWDAPTCKIGKSGQVIFVPKKSDRICEIKICDSLDNQKKHCRITVRKAKTLNKEQTSGC
jgi:hypothetical protein